MLPSLKAVSANVGWVLKPVNISCKNKMILDLGLCTNKKWWLTRFHPYPRRKVKYQPPPPPPPSSFIPKISKTQTSPPPPPPPPPCQPLMWSFSPFISMIRFRARSAYLLLVPQGRALIRDRALISFLRNIITSWYITPSLFLVQTLERKKSSPTRIKFFVSKHSHSQPFSPTHRHGPESSQTLSTFSNF